MKELSVDELKNQVLVKFGKIYKIFKVQTMTEKDFDKKVIYYKPLFISNRREDMTCSIPLENLSKASLRKPFSKSEFKVFLANLSKRGEEFKEKLNVRNMSELVFSDDLKQKSKILSHIWYRQHHPDLTVSTSETNFFQELMDSILEEFAYVMELDLAQAEKKILFELEDKSFTG